MTRKCITLLLLLGCYGMAQAQTQAEICSPTRLQLEIPRSSFDQRILNFKNDGKYKKLEDLRGSLHPEGITGLNLSEFFAKLKEIATKGNGVRIYFAAITKNGIGTKDEPYVMGRENTLIPIFVPTIEKIKGSIVYNEDLKVYYIPDVLQNNGLRKISDTTAKAWVNYYRNKFIPELTPKKDETQTLWFRSSDVMEWHNEMICQHEQTNSPVNTIDLFWGVYDKDLSFFTGVANRKPTGDLAITGKLTLLFHVKDAAILQKDARRQLFLKMFNAYKKKNKIAGIAPPFFSGEYDTGVPCPPAENCGDGYSL